MLLPEKLGFLQKLTGATNRQLAAAVNADPSFISRLRQGKRGLPRNSDYAAAMARYFARSVTSDYQRSALAETLQEPNLKLIMPAEKIADFITDWLLADESAPSSRVGKFLRELDSYAPSAAGSGDTGRPLAGSDAVSRVFYGNAGKRAAVLELLERLAGLDSPCTVLFATDENNEWYMESPEFSEEVSRRMLALSARGFRCRRIAAPCNSADAAFDALTRWLPIYLTGQSDTFYYPRLRDDVYRRTTVAAPGTAAVVSTSVGYQPDSGATLLTFDPGLADAVSEEFGRYFAKCVPAIIPHSLTDDPAAFKRCVTGFEALPGSYFRRNPSLSFASMPERLLRRLLPGGPGAVFTAEDVLEMQRQFLGFLGEYRCIDVVRLADPAAVRAGACPAALPFLSGNAPMYYTPEEYRAHLAATLDMLDRFGNYNVVLDETGASDSNGLYVKENSRTVLVRAAPPCAVFEVLERNIMLACEDYILRLTDTGPSRGQQRGYAAARIRALMEEL